MCISHKKREGWDFVLLDGPHLHTLIYSYIHRWRESHTVIITSHFIAPTHTFRGNFKLVWLSASARVPVALCRTEQSEPLAHLGMCSDFTESKQIWVVRLMTKMIRCEAPASHSKLGFFFPLVYKMNTVPNSFWIYTPEGLLINHRL